MKKASRQIVHLCLFQQAKTDMSSVVLFILLFSGFATLSFTLSDLRCQHGWALFGSRCYKIIPVEKTWITSEQYCVSMGGHLASVHSIEEYRYIQASVLYATKTNTKTWIGATDVEQPGLWVWTDGSAFDYTSWTAGEPDHLLTENCLEINYEDGWNDEICTNLKIFACSKPAFHAKIISVIQLKIVSKETLESDIEEIVQKVKQRLIDSGMPTNTTFRLQSIQKKPA